MPPQEGDRRTPVDNTTGAVHGGTVIQTGTIHGSVHLTSTRSEPVPRQLPMPPRIFTDREDEFRRLETLRHEIASEGHGRIMVLTGTGGVGKTALATRFLGTITEHFPDGTLYTDLQGFTESGPTDTSDVLDTFLRALGTEPAAIPRSFDARAAAFRSRTHGGRIALLLDNAVSAAQVRALTPGQGRHLVVVTTRLHLTGLRLDGAEFLDIRPLGEKEALELVTLMLGDDRADTDPASARRLVGLCGRLPLALRAAVSGLALRPHQPLDRLVSRLTDEGERLAALSHTRELSVDSVFTTSYRELAEPDRRLYRLLGVLPARDLTVEVAAALLGKDPPDTEDLLAHLVAANLLEEIPGDRFRQHDLIRLHARARADEDEPARAVEEALDRVLEYYLTTAAAADRTINPHRWVLAPVFDRTPVRDFDTHDDALNWLSEELPSLRSCVHAAHDSGRHSTCWQLCETLRNLFTLRRHYLIWHECYTIGLASGDALGDTGARACMLLALADAQRSMGDPKEAYDGYHRSLELWESIGHLDGAASSLEGCGMSELDLGRPARAIPHFRKAIGIYETTGPERGVTLMLRRLGRATRDSGEYRAAIPYFLRALAGFGAEDDAYMRARTLGELAAAHLALEDAVQAEEHLNEALPLATRVGASAEIAGLRVMRADAFRMSGNTDGARGELTRALAIYTSLADPRTEGTRRRLDSLAPNEDG